MKVVRRDGEWLALYCGSEGMKRKAQGVIIPGSLSEREVNEYIDGLFHEQATPGNSSVKVASKVEKMIQDFKSAPQLTSKGNGTYFSSPRLKCKKCPVLGHHEGTDYGC
ncbi:hypothetical protein [Marinimicrobium sp. LS-A18]|uniref:DUF7661 family protein n=1 Tax=Marinimicrobium sp. LS-A18 TaxID=1381596 RepID=UPI0009DBEAFE|nr:hypothetical protein [Marinimicrobium sp. LS-A18]